MPFDQFLLEQESVIRLGSFLGAFVLLALWELLAPRRVAGTSKAIRWTNNVALAVVNILVVRVFLPMAAVGMALFAKEHGTGLLNMFRVPYPLAIVASLAVFDLAVYLVHLAFHTAPVLWRVHRVHHADLDVDVSTAVRFHPIQILLSTLVKFAVILVLGPPLLAVLLFETVFHALVLFNHTNVRIAPAVDRVLRWFVVTPDMHRVHHSIHADETNSNFGFALPWWDRLLGTYRDEPAAGHDRMTLGIDLFRAPRDSRLDRMLLNPVLDPHLKAVPASAAPESPDAGCLICRDRAGVIGLSSDATNGWRRSRYSGCSVPPTRSHRSCAVLANDAGRGAASSSTIDPTSPRAKRVASSRCRHGRARCERTCGRGRRRSPSDADPPRTGLSQLPGLRERASTARGRAQAG
jgi:sterol desaturase/sphingolipid hydroxylase (fatty acid hydroxylase superfamily)